MPRSCHVNPTVSEHATWRIHTSFHLSKWNCEQNKFESDGKILKSLEPWKVKAIAESASTVAFMLEDESIQVLRKGEDIIYSTDG